MPPHPDMALVQALLVRALVARFAEEPYSAPLVRWGTALHERFLLPHFVHGRHRPRSSPTCAPTASTFDLAWFAPFLEFRFPRIGITEVGGVALELRTRHRAVARARRGGDRRRHRPLRRLLGRAAAGQRSTASSPAGTC